MILVLIFRRYTTYTVYFVISAIITGVLFAGCSTNVPVKEELTDYNDNSTVYMPYIKTDNPGLDKAVNDGIRQRLEESFYKIKADRDGTTTEGFTAFQSGDLLSIFQEGFFEPTGKAGDSYLTTLHINVKNGKFYSLDDLFIPDYKEKLSKIVNDILVVELGEYYMAYSTDLSSTSYDVFSKELIFIFNPGSVAPDHLGFIDVALSFDQIDSLLNKEGEFYQVVMAGAEQ